MPDHGNDPLFISVKEAARLLSISDWTVYQHCYAGTIESRKLGGRRLIVLASLKDYADNGGPTSTPEAS